MVSADGIYTHPIQIKALVHTSLYCGRILKYNALVYDSVNLGRFVHQGGLEEGLKTLCVGVEQKSSPNMRCVSGTIAATVQQCQVHVRTCTFWTEPAQVL
jgi:hypothetical protein